MEQKIIDSLILKLHELFPDIKAYDVKMEMDVNPPMFIIDVYDRRRRDRITPAGFFYTYYFEIIFFPGNDEPEDRYREIELELTDAVWLFGEGYRADDIHANSSEGILHVFFSVTVELKRQVESPPEIEEVRTRLSVENEQVSSQTIKRRS